MSSHLAFTRALVGALVLSPLCACDEVIPTTQIIVVVDAEPALRERIASVQVHTAHGTETIRVGEEAGQATFPFSFSLVPADDAFMGDVSVRALDEQGSEFLRRDMIVAFRSRRTLSYGVALTEQCVELRGQCEAQNETCVGCRGCAALEVLPEKLVPLRYANEALFTWQHANACEPDAGAP
jgi:hypothetical protein